MQRALRSLFIVLFVLGAAVQYNDPDPQLWILIYGIAAALTFDVMKGRRPLATGGFFLAGCLAYAVQLTIEVVRDGGFLDPVWIVGEKGREFLGLYGLALWTYFLIASPRSQSES